MPFCVLSFCLDRKYEMKFFFLGWLPGLPAHSFYVSHWEVSIECTVRLTITLVLLKACCGAHLIKRCLTTSMKLLCLNYLRQYLPCIAHSFILSYFVESPRVKSHIVIFSSIHYRNISLPTRYICMHEYIIVI